MCLLLSYSYGVILVVAIAMVVDMICRELQLLELLSLTFPAEIQSGNS